MDKVYILACVFVAAFAQESCVNKCKDIDAPVCGSDGITYKSLCLMEHRACVSGIKIEMTCDGDCPCASSNIVRNVIKIDRKTIEKFQGTESLFQLGDLKGANEGDILEFEILEEKDGKKPADEIHNARIVSWDQYHQKRSGSCPNEELSELPVRLIDWFHVLKLNKREEALKAERIEDEDIAIKATFMDSKLKAMYSQLACLPQDDADIEKAVCLKPVQWMFRELDSNNDDNLSLEELAEIEHIHNENCIKPFLDGCDANKDKQVTLKEFCTCLCVSPPCTKAIQDVPTMILRGEPRPMGKFTPTCDEDGFFMPKQCNTNNECWCVDRNGSEIKGTRNLEFVSCNGSPTKMSIDNMDLVPLDMAKENK